MAHIEIYPNHDELSQAACLKFIALASESINQRGQALIALSGGDTPLSLYQSLSELPHRDQIEWQKIHFFWADERCVPQDDPQSNYRLAWELFLSKVPVPVDNIHRIQGELEPQAAAKNYGLILKSYADSESESPRMDIVWLGLGEDGHTAALFPGSPLDYLSTVVAVTSDYLDRPAKRISMTPDLINKAEHVIFLVSGPNKSRILARVLDGEYHPASLPAQRIHADQGNLLWMMDEAAANELSMRRD